MMEYCSIEQWENAYHSWRYSTRLFLFGVLIPFAVLAVPLHILFTSLEFEPKNADITSRSTAHGDGTIQYEVIKNGQVVYTETGQHFLTPKYNFSDFDPKHYNPKWTFGDWIAPHGGTLDKFLFPPLMVLALFFMWAFVHLLVSLSRMTSTAKRIPFSKISAALCQNK